MQSRLFYGKCLLAATLIVPVFIFVHYNFGNITPNHTNSLLENETLGKIITRHIEFGWTVLSEDHCQAHSDYVLAQVLPWNIPIYVYDPMEDIHISRMIINSGTWEGPLISKIVDEMKKYPGAVFIDIGSNIGIYSMTMAALGHRVIAVDCYKPNVMRLCSSARKANVTSKISIVNNGISDKRTDLKLIESSEPNVGGMGVEQMTSPSSNVSKEFSSTAIVLDDLLETFSIKSAVMKMDVEKHEDEIFKGSKEFFDKVKVEAILLEFRFHASEDSGRYIIDFLDKYNLEPELPGWVNASDYSTWPGDLIWRKKSSST